MAVSLNVAGLGLVIRQHPPLAIRTTTNRATFWDDSDHKTRRMPAKVSASYACAVLNVNPSSALSGIVLGPGRLDRPWIYTFSAYELSTFM